MTQSDHGNFVMFCNRDTFLEVTNPWFSILSSLQDYKVGQWKEKELFDTMVVADCWNEVESDLKRNLKR